MKFTYRLLILGFLVLILSCSNDKNEELILDRVNFSEETISRLSESKIEQKELGNGIRQVNVTDLYAYAKDDKNIDQYLKFNLEKAKWVTDDNWDIAFYGRSILVNGGVPVGLAPYSVLEPNRTGDVEISIVGKTDASEEAKAENLVAISKITDGDYQKTTEVPTTIKFVQDQRNKFAIDDNSKGMSDYNNSPLEHVVTIKKKRFLIIKTIKGHYVKLKLKSLYKEGGKTATTATNMNEALVKYFPYFTFTYNYNTIKGDKKLN